MQHYQIVNIQEILSQKEGTAYKGEIGIFVSDNSKSFSLADNNPVYVNAFSYALILNGSARLSIDESRHDISKGTLCVLSPLHLTHFSSISNDFKCMFLCVHKSFVDKTGAFNLKQRIAAGMNLHRNPLLQISENDSLILQEGIKSIRRQILREEHHYRLELIQNALVRFYLELDNILEKRGNEHPVAPRDADRLRQFITLLMNHFTEKHQVGFYAEAMHITPQYLTAIVKKQTGKTVNAFIYELIYSEARNMLSATDLSIQEIALKLNFADQACFSKFFKRNSGLSPQMFRNQYTSAC